MADLPDKRFVVLRFTDGRYDVAADYGFEVWGSPLYEVIGYWPTYVDAREAVRVDRILKREEEAA